jgi:hypothetical protein
MRDPRTLVTGEWVEIPMAEGQCSWPPCTKQAIWKRKDGWMVAPGSPDGDVCEEHHCWEPLQVPEPPAGKHHRPPGEALCDDCWPGELADVEGPL